MQLLTARASFLEGLRANRAGQGNAAASVCSSHPDIWRALFRTALRCDRFALIESTSNQVNRQGGYSGMTPWDFVRNVRRVAEEEGFPPDRLLLGGDHLGPNFEGRLAASAAMDEACAMAADYVKAGYRKIHLDASFPCAGDPESLPDEITARRSARMAAACEAAASDGEKPLYIIGTEVPTPGGMVNLLPTGSSGGSGSQGQAQGPAPTNAGRAVCSGGSDFPSAQCESNTDGSCLTSTRPEDAARTLEVFEQVFRRNGLEDALERVVGLVVEAGVEFGDGCVVPYEPTPGLADFIRAQDGMIFEAHSTDYQTGAALQAMAAHHFYILKVGPCLSFALREGLFGLELLERELAPEQPSRFRDTLLRVMRDDPRHWAAYYPPDAPDRQLLFSYSDRCRYYLGSAEVRASVKRLWENLAARISEELLSQFLPRQWDRMRENDSGFYPAGNNNKAARDLAVDAVSCVLERYFEADPMMSLAGSSP